MLINIGKYDHNINNIHINENAVPETFHHTWKNIIQALQTRNVYLHDSSTSEQL